MRASLINNQSPPDIVVHGLVTPEDVDKLFDMYVNPSGVKVEADMHPSSFYTHLNVSVFPLTREPF